jgi:hypothetical protein
MSVAGEAHVSVMPVVPVAPVVPMVPVVMPPLA